MSGKVKNQHYVPQMYLERFTSNGRMSVWALDDDEIRTRQHPRNYAAKRYFYDEERIELKKHLQEIIELHPETEAVIDQSDEQFVEKYLARVESATKTIFDEIEQDHNRLYDHDNKLKLIIFLHDLSCRTEKYRDEIDGIRQHTIQSLSEMGISEHQVEGLGLPGKESQLYNLLGVAPLLRTSTMLLENYNWYIGTVSGVNKFIISDNPAQGIYLGFNDICIPINSNNAIILRTSNPTKPILAEDMPIGNEIKLSERSVLSYNALQLSYANRYIFGDRMSIILLKKLCDMQGGYSKLYGENLFLKPRK